MCGITGFAQIDDRLGESLLRRMTDTLYRRGPDDQGLFFDRAAGLGMRRLSIIDLAGSQQPIRSCSERYVLVFNGEIYNYAELRRDLQGKGYEFRSKGDGEVVANLYEHEGTKAFERLRGMFAVAIWDLKERELVIARDQLGIKPLFYSISGETLIFGSEIKSVLEAMPGKLTVDAQALDAVLAYNYIPAPLTIWKTVRKLRPGHCLTWKEGRLSERRYWDLLAFTGNEDAPPTDDQVRSALDDSVRAHLVSDVEIGAFLSGGVDSSLIVARMQHFAKSRVRAFSVKFETSSHLFDETVYARNLQNRYSFDLHVERLASRGYDSIVDAMRAFDEPFADDSIMPSDAISALAAQHVKVVVSGAGGDELFGGYNRYQGIAIHQAMSRLPGWVRRRCVTPLLYSVSRALDPASRRGDLVRRFARVVGNSADGAYLDFVTAANPTLRRRLLRPELAPDCAEHTRALIGDHLGRGARLDPLKRVMYADVNTYLPEDVLAVSDRIGMWYSLEIRTPLADRELAELSFRLPTSELVSWNEKKIALRRSVTGWLPKSILSHPKQGFEAPTASWLRQDGSGRFLERLTRHMKSSVPLMAAEPLADLLDEHAAGVADRAKILFSSLAIMEWAALHDDRIGDVA